MSQSLESIQESILEALHRGESIDRERVLLEHPQHAQALRAFFRVLDAVESPAATQETAPLTRLGEFEIVRELGRGGMGIVYEAVQLSLRRRVALKILPPALGGSSSYAQRFRREAEAAARLRHPGIVPVFACGEVSGTPFFALELVEGRSLAQCIAQWREGRFEPGLEVPSARWRWATELGSKVAQALAYAHSQGIVHRDVKPANILLERDGTPRLTDFGLAAEDGADTLTRSGEVFGSPRYMSPEQAFRRLQPIDGRSDVYSLGVTLYELLLLRYPYRGETSSEYLSEVSEGRVLSPRGVDPSIPVALEAALLRALAHDPAERYASAADFARDLADLVSRWESLEIAPWVPPPLPPRADPVQLGTTPELRTPLAQPGSMGRRRDRVGWWVALGCLVLSLPLLGVLGLAWFLKTKAIDKAMESARAYEEEQRALVEQAILEAKRAKATQAEQVSDPSWDPLAALTARDLEWLADGQHPAGPARLEAACRTQLQLRSTLARDMPLSYELFVGLNLAADVPPGIEVSYLLSVARQGQEPHYSSGEVVIPIIAVRTCEARVALSSKDTLGLRPEEASSEQAVPITLVHSLELRIARAGRTAGTTLRRELSVQTVQVLPSYPADYPRPLQMSGLKPRMEGALRPLAGRLREESQTVEQAPWYLVLDLPETARPAPIAGQVLVWLPGASAPFASGTFHLDRRSSKHAAGSSTIGCALQWAAMPQSEKERMQATLRSASQLQLRVRLESDRWVALAATQYDEMWYGAAEADVLVEIQHAAPQPR